MPIVGGATPGGVGAATGIFQSALQGLGGALQQPDAGAANLTPAQLTQLAELARAGLAPDALQTTAASMLRGAGAGR